MVCVRLCLLIESVNQLSGAYADGVVGVIVCHHNGVGHIETEVPTIYFL